MTSYGFAIDNRKCIGCHACSTACKSENEVPLGVFRTWVKSVETGLYPDVTRHFQVTRCNHCTDAPCATICPTSAMHKRDDGIVDFDKDACIGCKACMQACPYDAVHIEPETRTAAKCNFCAHRVTVGLEPACVVVCPEHAIVAGDLHDPSSELSRLLAAEPTTVRRPEKGTSPKLFYVDGERVLMQPTPPDAPPSVPYTVERKQERPWHWPVPAYLVTKAIAAGTPAVAALAVLTGLGSEVGVAAAVVSLVGLLATTALLVGDLERPERFLYILKRPNWDSWLARGAVVLTAFGALLTAWLGVEVMGLMRGATGPLRVVLLAAGTPIALMAAVYTAFLFAQAKGRDLWLNPWLAPHLAVQAIAIGAVTLLGLGATFGLGPPATHQMLVYLLTGATLIDLMLRAAEDPLWRSSFSGQMLAGGALSGLAAALPWLSIDLPILAQVSAPLAYAGLYLYEHAFVMAPQDIPNA